MNSLNFQSGEIAATLRSSSPRELENLPDIYLPVNLFKALVGARMRQHYNVEWQLSSTYYGRIAREPLGFSEDLTFLLAKKAAADPTAEDRAVLKGYPALVAQEGLGNAATKVMSRQSSASCNRRRTRSTQLRIHYGLDIELSDTLAQPYVQDPSGNILDAVLGSIQSASALGRRDFGCPLNVPKMKMDRGSLIDSAI